MFILLIIQRKNIWKKFENFSLSYILEDIRTQIHYSNNNAPEIDTTNKNELEQNVNVTFKDSLKAGTYRILVELYDEYGYYRTCDYVNFIVD